MFRLFLASLKACQHVCGSELLIRRRRIAQLGAANSHDINLAVFAQCPSQQLGTLRPAVEAQRPWEHRSNEEYPSHVYR